MKSRKVLPPIILIGCLVVTASAQYEPIIELEQLSQTVYKVTSTWDYDVNFVMSIGEDGVLLVDTGFKETAAKLNETLESLGAGPVKYIITTHAHVDHTGGNPTFGREATIIGQEMAQKRMTSGGYLLQEYPEEALPDIIIKDEIILHFNGEAVRIVELSGSHSDSDIGVVFPESKVAYLGDLAYGNKFPSTSGTIGSAAEYARVINKANRYLPDDVIVVSGHGDNVTKEDMIRFQDMLEQTTALVRDGLANGKDVATMQVENIFAPWAEEFGDYYVSDKAWINALATSLQPTKDSRAPMVEPLYHAFLEGGIDALINTFLDLNSSHADEYRFGAGAFYNFGKYLMTKNLFDEAVRFYKVGEREYDGNWIMVFAQAEAHMGKGNRARAVELFRRVLDVVPDQLDTIQILERLEAGNE